MKVERWQLQQRQAYDLDLKIELSKTAIRNWYEYWNGDVYVSFSGGKDSTVLLHLIRSLYPNLEAVFVDTGLEYPEIRQFVKTINNVIWLKPKMKFPEVLDKYGYPLISKEQARYIRDCQNATPLNEITRRRRLTGIDRNGVQTTSGMISNKWKILINSGIKVSELCCDKIKKYPIHQYEKNGKHGFNGVMASDSFMRSRSYLRTGCNSFSTGKSSPLGFWLEKDIWEYIKSFNIPYSSIYDKGETRTGCMFCMFGVHLEKSPNRFQRMQLHHPKLWNYCINTLNLRQPLDYIGVKYEVERLPILDYIEKER